MGLMLKKPADEPGAAWPAIVIGLFVAFGGVLFGYDTGTISGILGMRVWQDLFAQGNIVDGELRVSSSDEALIVSILSLGTFLGALTAAPIADWLGRRGGLIASTAIVFNLGVALQVAATDQPLFIAGRFFAGFGVGLISAMSKSIGRHCTRSANILQSHCISQRRLQSGSAVPSSAPTNWPSLLDCSLLPSSTMVRRT